MKKSATHICLSPDVTIPILPRFIEGVCSDIVALMGNELGNKDICCLAIACEVGMDTWGVGNDAFFFEECVKTQDFVLLDWLDTQGYRYPNIIFVDTGSRMDKWFERHNYEKAFYNALGTGVYRGFNFE